MKKLLLISLLLFGCGDDLSVETPPHDCGDAVVNDVGFTDVNQPQDVSEVNDAQDVIQDSVDATETDVGGVDSVNDVDDADSIQDTGDVAEVAEDATQVEDTQDSVDSSEDVSETADVPVEVPECVTDTDCADGNGCIVNETCSSGKCLAGVPFNCDDGNVCTDDSCESVGKNEIHVCTHLPNQATCTDGDACTLDDECNGMNCKSKSVAICDDNNICTNDSCDPIAGCVFLANEVTCTDNDACTIDDKCFENACKSGTLLTCSDSNDCTTDLCKPETGCSYENNQNVCSDNNVCSVNDICVSGICLAGPLQNCDDANLCTVDSCEPTTGCKVTNAADGTKCADGLCKNGSCTCVSGFGCAQPSFSYTDEVNAGMLGGMGGQVGPKMGCDPTDVIVGIGFDFSNGQKTATKTTVVCGKVSVAQDSTVSTVQTTTQKNGGSGCFGWDPSTPTPLVVCPNGWAVVGIEGTKAGGTLFNNVKLVCGKLGVNGKSTGETQVLNVEGTSGSGTEPQTLSCPAGTIARFFETRAGCGQDALTLYCAMPSPDCTGQELICKDL